MAQNLEKTRRKSVEVVQELENRPCSILLISSPHIQEQFPSRFDSKDPKWKQARQKWLNTRITYGSNAMFPGEPTPLLYATSLLQAELEKQGWPVGPKPEILGIMNPPVFDQGFVTDLVYKLTSQKPRIVGISNLSESHPTALRIARIVKKYSPSTIVIFGGMHETGTNPKLLKQQEFSLAYQRLLKHRTLGDQQEQKCIDFVVSGVGQGPLLELVKIVAENPEASTEEVKIAVKEKLPQASISGSAVVSYAVDGMVEDISMEGSPVDYNTLPPLNREHLTHPNFYPIFVDERGFPKPTAQLMLQHGCFESCSFCCEALNPKEFVKRDSSDVKQQMQVRIDKVVSEMQTLWGKGHKAIFFDDSTFLQNQALVEPFLDKVIQCRKEGAFDFEWGCQTTLLSFIPELAAKLAKAGCTYVYFGVENKKASTNVAKARRSKDYRGNEIKKENTETYWEEMFKKCVGLCFENKLRMGVSLQFGFPGETWEDQKATIDMLKPACEQGVLAMAALNINTLYPRSPDYTTALKQGRLVSDWREDLIRHPDFETFTQNSALTLQEEVKLIKVLERLKSNPEREDKLRSWATKLGISEEQINIALVARGNTEILNKLLEDVELKQLVEWLALKRSFRRGDRLVSYAKSVLGPIVLSGAHFKDPKVQEIIDQNRQAYSADAYFPPSFENYLKQDRGEKVTPGYLNSSAICRPLPLVRAEAERIFKLDTQGHLSEQEKNKIYEQARLDAAKLVKGATLAGTVLCSNTTEATSLTYWLAGLKDSSGANVVSTNAENVSTWFAMQMHTDHGNTKGEQGFSTFPTFEVRKRQVLAQQGNPSTSSKDLLDEEPLLTGTEVRKLDVFESTGEQILDQLEKMVDENTKLFVISHVLRDSGRLLPIKDICQKAREIKRKKNPTDPELCILIDGAQALGNLAKVNYRELEADFYVATPHKTMGSEVVGLLFFDPGNPRIKPNLEKFKGLTPQQQILKKGMFQPGFLSSTSETYLHNVNQELNPADIAGFVKANEILSTEEYGLRGGDFTTIVEKRSKLKKLCSEALQDINQKLVGKTALRVEEETMGDVGTPFILSFRLKGLKGDALPVIDGEGIQQKLYKTQILMQLLWAKGVYISLINRDVSIPEQHRFRVSFGVDNSHEDIELFAQALEKSILELSDFEKQLPQNSI